MSAEQKKAAPPEQPSGENGEEGAGPPQAGGWGSGIEFILTSLGFAVGLGNIWRFPNMVFSNGGGAFLIPYGLCLLFIAIPLLLAEAAIGQYSAKGPIGVWDMVPLFRGCGIASVVLSMISTIYYNAPISWAAFYLVSSMNDPLPWTQCGAWSTANCTEDAVLLADLASAAEANSMSLMAAEGSDETTTHAILSSDDATGFATGPAEEYFYLRALKVTSSLTQWGVLSWDLLVCNLVIWLIIFGVVCKGAESLGKVAYFTTLFPYVMLTAMLIFTSTLPGADLGIKFYLEADLSKLADVKVWRSAVSQVFFSTGCASGGVIQMASYNRFEHKVVRDTILVPILDGLTSLYAGFGVFTVLGYMAQQRGVSVANVVESGPGLIFVTYPEALSQMPGAAAWSFFFFFMVCILGLSSQFPSIETICGTLGAKLPWTQTNWMTRMFFRFVVCMAAFLLGIFFYFGNGYFTYFLIDERVIGYPMIIIGLVEAIGVAWVYGSDKLMSNIEEMTGAWRWKWLKIFWVICWKIIAPTALGLIFILDVATLEPLELRGYTFPHWAISLAGFIMSIPLACMVLYALHIYCKTCEGYRFLQKTTLPNKNWIPASRSRSNLGSLASFSTIGGIAINFDDRNTEAEGAEDPHHSNTHHHTHSHQRQYQKNKQRHANGHEANADPKNRVATPHNVVAEAHTNAAYDNTETLHAIYEAMNAKSLHDSSQGNSGLELTEFRPHLNDSGEQHIVDGNLELRAGSLASLSLSSTTASETETSVLPTTTASETEQAVEAPARRRRPQPEEVVLERIQHNDNNAEQKRQKPATIVCQDQNVEFCV